MTNYYLRTAANGGSDAAAGTSAGTAWATWTKALGAAGIASGDTLYVGPGTYRETVAVAMTSAVAETTILADVTGQYTGDAPGDVILSAYTTNDTTTPSTTALLNLAGRDYLTFKGIVFVGANAGTGGCVLSTTTNAINITLEDCTFIAGNTNGTLIEYIGLADIASNWTINRCKFLMMSGTAIQVTLPTSASADYDSAFLIQNCTHVAAAARLCAVTTTGAGSFKGGGVLLKHNTVISNSGLVSTGTANVSTSIPVECEDNLVLSGSSAGFSANTAGQITENYNRYASPTARTNVTPGANSIDGVTNALLLEIGQHIFGGRRARAFLSPTAGSPLMGAAGGTGIAVPSVDIFNRVRPAGGASTARAIGAFERHDTATKETSVTDAGGVAIKITGPGDQDIQIPVTAAATVITVRCRYDTNHANTNKPQAILLANGEIGVTTETVTGAAAIDTWETLTFASQTPTAAGVVTIRLVSRSAAANGIAYFDSVTVS